MRTFILSSPLGDALQFRGLNGDERLSELYEWHLDAQSASNAIPLNSLLGKGVSVRIETAADPRYLHGIVTQARMLGSDESRNYLYRLTVRPWLWLATKVVDHRIWQHVTVPDIIERTLAPFGFQIENRLIEKYRVWTYCVQYQESCFDFVSRLMEHEGIYYYFEHDEETHRLVLCDDVTAHRAFPGYESIPFVATDNVGAVPNEYVHVWQPSASIHSGSVELRDFDFEKPDVLLSVIRSEPKGYTFDALQQYRWPGGYTEDEPDGAKYARVMLDAEQAEYASSAGQTSARGVATGRLFALTACPREDQNREYLIRSCEYRFEENPYHTGASEVVCDIRLSALPGSLPYRSAIKTPKPRIPGPQTAVVTGPAGTEIYCDKYSRVKVHFPWDRHGSRDENSSCWIRVSNLWASANFGGIQVPRIGDEVIVEHLDGDPDYPIITGRVYNAMKMPPWELPANATQMGILTRSSPGGNPSTANALRFEDKMGQEEVWLHAEKDQRIEVEHDESHWVGNDRTKNIDGNETVHVKKNRTETVAMNETIAVGMNRTEVVGMNESVVVGMNQALMVTVSQETTVGMNATSMVGEMREASVGMNDTLSVGQNWQVSAGKQIQVGSNGTAAYIAKDKLVLQCGQASISLESNGNVSISGTNVVVQGSQQVEVTGAMVHIN